MTRFIDTTALFLLAACAGACGGGDDAASEDGLMQDEMPAQPAGGSAAGGGQQTQNDADDEPPACTAPAAMVVAEGTDLSELNLTADAVYYVDGTLGTAVRSGSSPVYNGGVKRYSFASGETSTLWVAEGRNVLQNLLVGADALYVSLTENFSSPAVYRLPLSGQGTLAPVGPEETMNDAGAPQRGPMGIVGDELIVDGSGAASAVSLSDGTSRALLPGDIKRIGTQLVGPQLWYATDYGRGSIFRLDVTTRPPAPVEVYPGGCTGGSLTTFGWFFVAGSELICAGSRMFKLLGADGSGEKGSWPGGPVGDAYIPAHADDAFVYFASSTKGLRVPRAGGSQEVFSCDGVPVDGISTNADYLVWGKSTTSGVGASPFTTYVKPATYQAILALRR